MDLPWELRRRGFKDSLRHDQRVKDAIRKNLRELIAEEAIITSDGRKTVKIPVRYLDQYRFKYGQPQPGVGQGPGQPGEILSHGTGANRGMHHGPGEQPGEATYEVEVPLADITQMMLEDLALPWLEEKPERQIRTASHQYTDIRRRGPLANLDKRRTLLNNIKRNAARGVPEIGDFQDADLRFKVWDNHEEAHANAAIYMLMDRSGSMTTGKKYVAKSFFFWMVRFLRHKYRQVETVFIAHDVDAQVVPEQDFFALSNSGGTKCSSAYQLAWEHQQQHYPTRSWNLYLFHFSDGDNWPEDNPACQAQVTALLDLCTMVGYGEIRYDGDDIGFYGWPTQIEPIPSSLQSALQNLAHPRLCIVTLSHKDDVYQALQTFLQPREPTHV